jgi:hypothetical protein
MPNKTRLQVIQGGRTDSSDFDEVVRALDMTMGQGLDELIRIKRRRARSANSMLQVVEPVRQANPADTGEDNVE